MNEFYRPLLQRPCSRTSLITKTMESDGLSCSHCVSACLPLRGNTGVENKQCVLNRGAAEG